MQTKKLPEGPLWRATLPQSSDADGRAGLCSGLPSTRTFPRPTPALSPQSSPLLTGVDPKGSLTSIPHTELHLRVRFGKPQPTTEDNSRGNKHWGVKDNSSYFATPRSCQQHLHNCNNVNSTHWSNQNCYNILSRGEWGGVSRQCRRKVR